MITLTSEEKNIKLKLLPISIKDNINYEECLNSVFYNQDKMFLGNKEEKRCRFCNKAEPEVKFNKLAHAIPQLMGNNIIFSHYECDDCNLLFGQKYENSFANFMLFDHTLLGVRTKKGVVKLKYGNDKSTMIFEHSLPNSNENNILRVGIYDKSIDCQGNKIIEDSIQVEFDDKNKIAIIKSKTPSYIPLNVYKCLIKIALTLLPEDEIVFFEETIKWIMDVDKGIEYAPVLFINYLDDGGNADKDIFYAFYTRKDNSKSNFPYKIFQICYGSFVFQFSLPFCSLDKKENFLDVFQFIDCFSAEQIIGFPKLINMNSGEKYINQTREKKFTYESYSDVDMTLNDIDFE